MVNVDGDVSVDDDHVPFFLHFFFLIKVIQIWEFSFFF